MKTHHNQCSPDAFEPGRPRSAAIAALCVMHLIVGVVVALAASGVLIAFLR
jgi:hypothetical protein